MTTTSYGTRYAATKDLRRVDLAKLIRKDIKEAVASGLIPTAKYSVTCESFAGGGSIDVTVSDVAHVGFVLTNPARLLWEAEHPHDGLYAAPSEAQWLLSEEARAVLAAVEAIVAAYNYDGSDPTTDYYNVRFYGSVTFGGRWEEAKKDEERAALAARLAETVPAAANDLAAEALPSHIDWLESLGVST